MGLWVSFSFPSQRRAGSMLKPPYRVLRIVLGFLSLLLAVAGILLIFSSKPLIMRMFMHPPASEISTLLLAAVKEMGGLGASAYWRSRRLFLFTHWTCRGYIRPI